MAERCIAESARVKDESSEPIYTYPTRTRSELVALLRRLVSIGVTWVAYDPRTTHANSVPITNLLAGLQAQ